MYLIFHVVILISNCSDFVRIGAALLLREIDQLLENGPLFLSEFLDGAIQAPAQLGARVLLPNQGFEEVPARRFALQYGSDALEVEIHERLRLATNSLFCAHEDLRALLVDVLDPNITLEAAEHRLR